MSRLPELPVLTARQAEELLLRAGFAMARSTGSHRIYIKGSVRVVVPFHAGRTLHPKVTKQVLKSIADVQKPG